MQKTFFYFANFFQECGYPVDVSDYHGETQLGEFLDEVRRVFKEEMDVQMEQETNADRIRDIEEDARYVRFFRQSPKFAFEGFFSP